VSLHKPVESFFDNILNLLVTLGLGVLVVFGGGFWLFHLLKRDAEKRDRDPSDDSPKS